MHWNYNACFFLLFFKWNKNMIIASGEEALLWYNMIWWLYDHVIEIYSQYCVKESELQRGLVTWCRGRRKSRVKSVSECKECKCEWESESVWDDSMRGRRILDSRSLLFCPGEQIRNSFILQLVGKLVIYLFCNSFSGWWMMVWWIDKFILVEDFAFLPSWEVVLQ